MRLSVIAAVACVPLFAQFVPPPAQPAPPAVDAALRARVGKFYQAYVDGKFRIAEQLVADDSRDFFFEIEKQKILGYEKSDIQYSENFTKARVLTILPMEVRNARLGKIIVRPPTTSFWKLEKGEWWWYHLVETVVDTPFGKSIIRDEPEEDPAKKLATFKRVSPSEVLNQVSVSGGVVVLSNYQEASGEVTVSNGLPGQVTIDVTFPPVAGLTITPEKKVLKGGETSKVLFHFKPANSTPGGTITANIVIQPLNRIFPIAVSFPSPRPTRVDGTIH